MKKQIALIEDAFTRLHFLDHKSWSAPVSKMLEACMDEERRHRGAGDSFKRNHPHAVSIPQAARLFAVKRVAEYLQGERMPRGKQFAHMQTSCFHAAALVDEYRKDIRKAWRGLPVAELAALDYYEFASPEDCK